MGKVQALRDRTLERLTERLERLPVLPSIVSRIVALDSERADFSDLVEKLVRQDPPFAARLLRLATRGLGSKAVAASTLPAAIARVGARGLSDAITAYSVMEVFVPTTQGQRNLWWHALQVAAGAKRLAELRPELEVKPEEAYLAGLLHDVGRFVMFERSPRELGAVDEAGCLDPDSLVSAEMAICGFDHAELGWLVCSKWALPERVAILVRDHHVYETEERSRWPPEMERLNGLVQAADWISFMLLLPGLPAGADERRARVERFRTPHTVALPMLSADDLTHVVEEIDRSSRRLAEGLIEIGG